ncbi:MAG: exonuclease SbcCD subunit D [Dehalococcoidia bacterium]
MRILHFADLHIGVENYGRVDPETGMSTRLMDFLAALDEVVEYALTQDVDLVLLAGDAYKSRDPNQTQQRELAQRLAKLSSAGIPVFLLVGNHDLPHAVGRATAIEIFNTLQVPNLHVGDQIQTYPVETPKGPLQIVALPWPRRSRLLTREDTRGLSIDQINERVQDLLTQGVKLAADRLDPSMPAILTGHLTVSGATLGSERSMMMGQDHVLLPSSLHLPVFDYIALGHIHKHQILRENPMMVYAGSLQRVDFGEEGDTKGFCVVELDPGRMQGMRLVDFRFQPVHARNFVTVDVRMPEGSEDPTQEVIHAVLRHNVADSIVRVRISLTAEQSTQLREAEIREALKEAHYVTSVSRQVEEERRTRIPADTVEGLDPLQALGLYLESRGTDPQRQKKLLEYAQKLVDEELSDQEA